MSPARVTVRIEGVRKLLRDLRDDPVYARPWSAALKKAVLVASNSVEKHAPGGAGSRAKVKIQDRPVPLWGRVSLPNKLKKASRRRVQAANARGVLQGKPPKSPKGFRYLGALHGSRRIKYHYRSGPFSGQLTFDWFGKARDAVDGQIRKILANAEETIQRVWGSSRGAGQ